MNELANSISSTIKFVYEGAPVPDPTPINFDFNFDFAGFDLFRNGAASGDGLSSFILLMLLALLIGAGVYIIAKKRVFVGTGKLANLFAPVSSFVNKHDKKIKSVFIAIAVALCSIILMTSLFGKSSASSAYANSNGEDVTKFKVETKDEIICHVKGDGTLEFENSYLKNLENIPAIFSYITVESPMDLGAGRWHIFCDDNEVYNQPANISKTENKSFAVGINANSERTIRITSDISWDLARSLASISDAVKITYVVTPNLLKSLSLPEGTTSENATGILERSFVDSPWNVKRATAVEFIKPDLEEKTLEEYAQDKARKYPVWNEEKQAFEDQPYIVDLSESQNKTILGIIVDDEETNSYKVQIISDDLIYANSDSLSYMFRNFNSLYDIKFDNLSFNYAQDVSYMFSGAGRDDGAMMTIALHGPNGENLEFPENTDANHMFANCNASIDLTKVKFGDNTNMDYFFQNFGTGIIEDVNGEKTRPLQMTLADEEGGFKIPGGTKTSSYRMFEGMAIDLTPTDSELNILEQIDTTNADNLVGLFANYCQYKNDVTLDITSLEIKEDVNSMAQMFEGAFAGGENNKIIFAKPGEKFNLAKDVSSMFKDCSMKLDMTNFDFSKVENMSHFLDGFCKGEEFPFEPKNDKTPVKWPEDFAVSENGCNASYMYANTSMYPDVIALWDASKITNMEGFFYGYMRGLVGPVSHTNTSGEDPVTINLSQIAFGDVDTTYKFAEEAITGDLDHPGGLSSMFEFAYCNVDMSNVDVSGITHFNNMFKNFGGVNPVSKGETTQNCNLILGSPKQPFVPVSPAPDSMYPQPADFSHMFDMAQLTEIDLTNVVLSNGHKFSYMFNNLGQWFSINITSPMDIATTAMSAVSPFYSQIKFPEEKWTPCTAIIDGGIEGAQLDYMFHNYNWDANLVNGDNDKEYFLDLSTLDVTNVQNFEGMFSYFNSHPLSGIKPIASGTTMQRKGNLVLPESFKPVAQENMAKANMSHMFEHANAYMWISNNHGNIVNLDLNGFDTSNVADMSYMFNWTWRIPYGPLNMQSGINKDILELADYGFVLDVSKFNVSNVTDMSYMFSNTFVKLPAVPKLLEEPVLNGKLSLFTSQEPAPSLFGNETGKCNAEHMFDGCGIEELDLTNTTMWNVNDLTRALSNLGFKDKPCKVTGLSDVKIKNGCKLTALFENSYLQVGDETPGGGNKLDLKGWDVSEVEDMSYLFYKFEVDELDISTWNPAKCVNMEGMFQEFGNDTLTLDGSEPKEPSVIKFPDGTSKDSQGNPIYWRTGDNCNMKYMFSMCLADVDLSYFDVSKVTNMEGMFLAYGAAEKQIKNLVSWYIGNLLNLKSESSDFASLATNAVDEAVDASLSEFASGITSSTSTIDEYTKTLNGAFNYLDAASKVDVATNEFGFNADEINANNPSGLSNILSDAGLTSEAYNNEYLGQFNKDASIHKAQLKTALVSTLSESADEDKLIEILNEAAASPVSGESNLGTEPFKVTFPNKDFNPGTASTDKTCSMKEMFALFDFAGILAQKSPSKDDVQKYVPNFSGFNTSNVNDMSYMFFGFMIMPLQTMNEWTAPLEFDISSFNTAKVESMKMMFAATGLYFTLKAINAADPKTQCMTKWKFGEGFTINTFQGYDEEFKEYYDVPCDVSYMFALCFAQKIEGLEKINVENAMSTSCMFAFSEIADLNISGWQTSKITDLSHMFAYYGFVSSVIPPILNRIPFIAEMIQENKLVFEKQIILGTKGTTEGTPKFVLAPDANVAGMFMVPSVTKLDLTNMDVSRAKSLARMFEYYIPTSLFTWDLKSPLKTDIDISTWNTSNVVDFTNMFAYSLITNIYFPSNKLQTAAKANLSGMFMYCHYVNLEKYTESSNEYERLYFDASTCINLTNVGSAKQMFVGFNSIFQFTNKTYIEKSYITLGSQTMNFCEDMSRMFELTPMGIDISGVSTSGSLYNMDRMFAFSGYHYLSLDKKTSKVSFDYLMNNFVRFKTEIKLPESEKFIPKEASVIDGVEKHATANYMFLFANTGDLSQTPEPEDPEDETKGRIWKKASTINMKFLNSANVKEMEGMFMLQICPLDLSSFDISASVNMKYFFTAYGLLSLQLIANVDTETGIPDIRLENLPKITYPSGQSKLVFNEAAETDYMFTLYSAKADVSASNESYYDMKMFDVAQLKNFDYMFAYSLGLFNFDIGSWNLTSAEGFNHTFQGYGMLFNTLYDYICAMKSELTLPYIDTIFKTKDFVFPYLPSTTTQNYSTEGMFAFATILKLESEAISNEGVGKLKVDKTFDISDFSFCRMNNASYMFAGYGLSPFKSFVDIGLLGMNLVDSLFDANMKSDMTKIYNKIRIMNIPYPKIIFNKTTSSGPDAFSFADNAVLDGMFAFSDSSLEISGMNFSKVKSVNQMFAGYAPSFDLRFENTRILPNFPQTISFAEGCEARYMFAGYHPDKLDLTIMNVSNITDFTGMFALCLSNEINVSNWNTANAKIFMATFAGAQTNIVDLSTWNFNNVTDMSFMFAYFGSISSTSTVKFPMNSENFKPADDCNANRMFYASNLEDILLYGFNNECVEQLSDVDYMFNSSYKLKSIVVNSEADWRGKNLSGTYMFEGCTNLVGSTGYAYKNYHTNIDYAVYDTDEHHGYFTAARTLREPYELSSDPSEEDSELTPILLKHGENYPGFTAEQLQKVNEVRFERRDASKQQGAIDLSATPAVANTGIYAYIDGNTLFVCSTEPIYSGPKSFVNMFNWKSKSENDTNEDYALLYNINFGSGVINAITATSMYGTFANCINLKSVDAYNLNTTNVKNMAYAFYNVGSNRGDGLYTNVVFNYEGKSFNTSSALDMSNMFANAKLCSSFGNLASVNNLDLTHFNSVYVTSMKQMFEGYNGMPINFPTSYAAIAPSEACDFEEMFKDIQLQYLDLSGFLLSPGSNVKHMFAYSSKEKANEPLSKIYVHNRWGAATDWKEIDVKDKDKVEVFKNCGNLKKQATGGFTLCQVDNGNFTRTNEIEIYGTSSTDDLGSTIYKHNDKVQNSDTAATASLNEIRFGTSTNFNDYSNAHIIACTQCSTMPVTIYSAMVSPNLFDTVIISAEILEFQNNGFVNLTQNITSGLYNNKGLKSLTSIILDVKQDSRYNGSYEGMFANATALKNIKYGRNFIVKDWVTLYPTSLKETYKNCASLTHIDISNLGTWYLTDTTSMFDGCISLKTINVNSPDTDWSSLTDLTNHENMFKDCKNLVGGGVFKYESTDQKHDITYAKACPTSGEERKGFFTYGAVLRSTTISEELSNLNIHESLIDYIMTDYMFGESPSNGIRVILGNLGISYKSLVTSVNFYSDFMNSEEYKKFFINEDGTHKNGTKQINITEGYSPSTLDDSGVYAFVYTDTNNYIEIAGKKILPTYKIAISSRGKRTFDEVEQSYVYEEFHAPIIAQEDSLIGAFNGLTNLGSGLDGYSLPINFFADKDSETAVEGMDEVLVTSSVRDMSSMFENTFSNTFNQQYRDDEYVYRNQTLDLTDIDTSSVENFDSMFKNCKVRLLRLDTKEGSEKDTKFSIENAKSMKSMFEGFGQVCILEKSTGVEGKSGMGIIDCPSSIIFPLDFKTQYYDCDVTSMFSFCHIINLDVSNLDFTNFKNMDYMFAFAGGFRFINASNAGDSELLSGAGIVNNKEDFDFVVSLAKAVDSGDIAKATAVLENVNKLQKPLKDYGNGFSGEITFPDTWGPKVEGATANSMFMGLMMESSGTQNMNTSKIVSMNKMFALTPFIKYIYTGNNTAGSISWDTSKVEDMESMFAGCGRIDGTSKIGNYPNIPAEVVEPDGKLHFKFISDCNVAYMFRGAHIPVDLSLTVAADNPGVYGLDVISDYNGMFQDYAIFALPTLAGVGIGEETPIVGSIIGTLGHPENMKIVFRDGADTNMWTPPKGARMDEMFRNCKAPLDLSRLDSKNVISYQYMFADYGKRPEIDEAYKLAIDNVKKYVNQYAPDYINLLNQYLELIDGVEIYGDPTNPDKGDSNLCLWPEPYIDFKKLTTENAVDVSMKGMFMGYYGSVLEIQDETYFNTVNVVDMSEMFCGCRMDKIDISGFDTTNVRDMSYMFESETLLPFKSWQIKFGESFKLDNVVDMSYMFGSLVDENSELRQIVVPEANSNWTGYIKEQADKGRVIFTDNMFFGAVKLVGNIKAKNHDHVTIYNSDVVDGYNSSYKDAVNGGYARVGYSENDNWFHGYFTLENGESPDSKEATVSNDTEKETTKADDAAQSDESASATEEEQATEQETEQAEGSESEEAIEDSSKTEGAAEDSASAVADSVIAVLSVFTFSPIEFTFFQFAGTLFSLI